jgi:oligopeptide transport system permease protein
MSWILFKRVGTMVLTLFCLCTITFFLVRLAPGNPFESERHLDEVAEKALNARYGFDRSLPEQYFMYMGHLLRGDLGLSTKFQDRTINEIISSHLPVSIALGALSLFFAILLGVGSGIFAALYRGKGWDLLIMSLAVLGLSLPTFVIGPGLQVLFGMKWPILPLAGYEPGLTHLILPAITLALPFAARIARLTRAGLLDILGQNYIKAGRSRGFGTTRLVFVHALKGALLPLVSFLGPAIAGVATGTVVVEKIFQIPGLGRDFIESALNRDPFLVLGTALVYGVFLVFSNFLTDLLTLWMNPRLRGPS